jgi:hypothetical protein
MYLTMILERGILKDHKSFRTKGTVVVFVLTILQTEEFTNLHTVFDPLIGKGEGDEGGGVRARGIG